VDRECRSNPSSRCRPRTESRIERFFLLAEKLSHVFAGPIDEQNPTQIHSALEEYAQSRKADRTATIGLTDFMARIFTSNLVPIVFARGLALSALQWFPPVKTALARQMMFGRR
jgi:2-octaprenyl-6-methoxyphenol hydroxylase